MSMSGSLRDRNGNEVHAGNEVRHAVEDKYGTVAVVGGDYVIVESGVGETYKRATWRAEEIVLWDSRK